MDALAIITALDYIKNEEVYIERFNKIKAEQVKLEQLRNINSTIEEIQVKLEQVEALKAVHTEKLKQADIEIDKLRTSRLVDLDERDNRSKIKQIDSDNREQILTNLSEKLRIREQELHKERQQLDAYRNDVEQRSREAQTKFDLYNTKLDQLRTLLNG